MKRRSLFRLVLGAITAGLARPWWTRDKSHQLGSFGATPTVNGEDFGPHTALPAPDGLAFRKDAFEFGWHHEPFPFKLFAEFPAPIEAMETIKSNAVDEHLLVIAGGIAYIVDKHGVAKRL